MDVMLSYIIYLVVFIVNTKFKNVFILNKYKYIFSAILWAGFTPTDYTYE
jgi:hypothetical protein